MKILIYTCGTKDFPGCNETFARDAPGMVKCPFCGHLYVTLKEIQEYNAKGENK